MLEVANGFFQRTGQRIRVTRIVFWLIAAWAGPVSALPANDNDWAYVVVPGDNLHALAQSHLAPRFGARSLQRLNRVADPRRLQPGRVLRMPLAWLRADPTAATVVHLSGRVRVGRGGGAAITDLAPGDQVRAGDLIVAEDDAGATLQLVDASRLIVAGGSSVRLESLVVLGRSGVVRSRIAVDKGEAESRVNPRRSGGMRYEVRTPVVTLGVRGTEFRVRVDDETTRAEVAEGRVVAITAGARGKARSGITIEAGFGLLAGVSSGVAPLQALLGPPALAGLPPLVERLPFGFAWPALAGAAGYRAQVFADPALERRLLDAVSPSPSARWADLADGDYRLEVRARNASGLEGRGAQHAFVVKARPEAPFTTTPRALSRVIGERVELAWTRPVAAQRYRLQLGSDPQFADTRLDRSDLVDDRLVVELPPGHYHWRLASIAAAGDQGPFGDASSFDLEAAPPPRQAPPPPALDAPAVKGGQLAFHWQARDALDTFDVQVAHDPQFERRLLERRVGEPDLVIDAPDAGRYFIRVRTVEPDGLAGPFGAAQQFEVQRSLWYWLLPGVVILLMLL